MALPILNSDYSFELIQPSTGDLVRYRAYLVKEEKKLLMAAEAQDKLEMMKAIRAIVDACFENINSLDLPLFDLEYMFLHLRAKSAGELTEVGFNCESCEHPNPVALNLEAVVVENAENKKTRLDIAEGIKVEMRYPTLKDITSNPDVFLQEGKQVEMMFGLIDALIDKVYTEEDVIDFHDEPKDKRVAFIDSFNQDQFMKLRDFIESIPQAEIPIKFTCENCGHENERNVQGLANFFG